MERNYIHVVSLLRHHLQFLHFADPVLRVEHDNPGAFHIREPCQRRFPGIPRCGGQYHDLILNLILLRRHRHQMRQNRQCHILERNRSPME